MDKEQKTTFISAGELAKKAGVTTRALRFYDKKGLLKPAATGAGNVRYYTEKEVERLNEILCYKMMGMSLQEISERIGKGNKPSDMSAEFHERVLQMEEMISQQMKRYSIMRDMETVSAGSRGNESWGAFVGVMDYIRVKWDVIWQVNEAHEKDISLPEDPGAADEKMKQYYKILVDALELMNKGVAPEDDAMMKIMEKFYSMNADIEMIHIDPQVMKIRRTSAVELWTCIEEYMSKAAGHYLSTKGK
ncbi:MAG: MerR family transcriptional regulator [Clostridia bacterium]|nr:MerR family transcriptional regulator [Clostridia bacterium]